ncbi:hypothetical protein PPBDW_II0396 [Photobacterium kishitanii]|nr:hypothetical protein PPBDW_II0396 [Photobacterium kishitanii]
MHWLHFHPRHLQTNLCIIRTLYIYLCFRASSFGFIAKKSSNKTARNTS